MNFDLNYFKEIAKQIFNVHSPSGYHIEINQLLQELLSKLGYKSTVTNKGNVVVKVLGESNSKTLATSGCIRKALINEMMHSIRLWCR